MTTPTHWPPETHHWDLHETVRTTINNAHARGILPTLLNRYRLHNLAVWLHRQNPGGTQTYAITRNQYERLNNLYTHSLKLTKHPTRFRLTKDGNLATFTTKPGHDWIDQDLLGGTGDGTTRTALERAGLTID